MPGTTRTVDPTVEPITLAEAKLHLRVDVDDDNDLITTLIQAAREQAEVFTRRAFISQTWQRTLDEWPAGQEISLQHPPVQSITSITYVDIDGATQTLSSDVYELQSDDEPGRVTLQFGESWPTVRAITNAITITYVAGYGDAASNVPAGLKAAIKLLIGSWYENREAVVTGITATIIPLGVEQLLLSFKTFHLEDANA